MNGILLMTYGSPTSLDEAGVGAYLERVRGGRAPDEDLVREFTRRYQVIGGSPLIEITERQAAALESTLGWPAAAGMRFSEPSIAASLGRLTARGVTELAAIILSPQYSPLLMGGYGRALEAATESLGDLAPRVRLAGAWHLEPSFVDAVASGIRLAVADIERRTGHRPAVLLTAHSLPRRVADTEPGYLDQLEQTAGAVAGAAGLERMEWRFCWQSAGHEPGEWMKPDFADLMPELAAAGYRAVLVAPVQFFADHLETLYDIDVGAREQAEAARLDFRRVKSLNADPALIAALAEVARRTLQVALEQVG